MKFRELHADKKVENKILDTSEKCVMEGLDVASAWPLAWTWRKR